METVEMKTIRRLSVDPEAEDEAYMQEKDAIRQKSTER